VLIASCKTPPETVENIPTGVYDDFQSVLNSGNFTTLADQLDPDVLMVFRRQLNFEGAWFSNQAIKSEIESMEDREFFVRYMNAYSETLGNPFKDTYSSGKVVSMISGSKGYRHYIVTMEGEYSFPITFSFRRVDEDWLLVEPCFVSEYANRVRKSKGK